MGERGPVQGCCWAGLRCVRFPHPAALLSGGWRFLAFDGMAGEGQQTVPRCAKGMVAKRGEVADWSCWGMLWSFGCRTYALRPTGSTWEASGDRCGCDVQDRASLAEAPELYAIRRSGGGEPAATGRARRTPMTAGQLLGLEVVATKRGHASYQKRRRGLARRGRASLPGANSPVRPFCVTVARAKG
jgi:hypothetical protein